MGPQLYRGIDGMISTELGGCYSILPAQPLICRDERLNVLGESEVGLGGQYMALEV